jgi:2-(1,2-epoxy-1,2-dihydrophenyl)acetyl-CoA isomerase
MSSVLIEKKGAVAWLILNKPEKLNVLGIEMAEGLKRCTEELKDDEGIRCVIITGAGDHFMAGGDLDYFKSLIDTYETGDKTAFSKEIFDLVHQAILNITSMQKPVIASVKGAVAGFGLSLMLASDLAIAAEDATLSVAYCKIGTTPDGGMTYFLPRAVGQKRAMELALTGQRFSAEQAEKWGMLNQVVGTELLEAKTLELAESFCDGPSDVLARTKQLLNNTYDVSLKERLDEEAANFYESMRKKDFKEGVTSFCERRSPKFNQ